MLEKDEKFILCVYNIRAGCIIEDVVTFWSPKFQKNNEVASTACRFFFFVSLHFLKPQNVLLQAISPLVPYIFNCGLLNRKIM